MKTHKGLTLVGAIVSVSILGVSLAAFMNYQAFLIRANVQKKYATVGAFLASEGVEVARGIRDGNYKEIRNTGSGNWNDGITTGTYTFDANSVDLGTGFDTSSTCNVSVNASCEVGGATQYELGAAPVGATIYRYVSIPSSDLDTVEVESVVVIRDRGYEAEYTATTTLYNTDRL